MQEIRAWVKGAGKGLVAFLVGAVAAVVVVMPGFFVVMVFVKWLTDKVIFDVPLTKFETFWYGVPLGILSVIMIIYLQERFAKWLTRRFGVSKR